MTKRAKLSVAILAAADISAAAAGVPFAETGMRSFDDWTPDKTGKVSVASKLETAIVECAKNGKTLYIAPGIYLVDRTVNVVALGRGNNNGKGHPHIHGDAYNRPLIRLKDHTFPESKPAEEASPVFLLDHVDPEKGANWIYFSILSNLNIDLGTNPGGAGVSWGAAQDSHIFNVKVYGKAFAVGFNGFPGRNSGNVNLEVEGGQCGMYMRNAGLNLTGVRLVGQSTVGVIMEGFRGSTIVGLEVVDCDGPAIECRGGWYEQGHLYLLDGRLELTNSSAPAIRIGDRSLVLRNVYVKGTTQIVEGNTSALQGGPADQWNRVKHYAIAPAFVNDHIPCNYVDGVMKTVDEQVELELVTSPPADIRTRHLPDEVYAFNHPEAVNALQSPGSSASEKIQNAIDGPARVIYIPAGDYDISSPLHLKQGKVILGDPGKRTFVYPVYSPENDSYVITTENADGYVAIQDFYFVTRDRDYDGAVKWQTSSGFMLNVRHFKGHGPTETDVRAYTFAGEAGGKFYGMADHRNIARDRTPKSDRFRKVYLEKTHNPITFYGLNLERGGNQRHVKQNPFFEAIQCSNVRVLGCKSEPDDGVMFRFDGCRNFAISSLSTHRNTDYPLLEIAGQSSNYEVALVGCASNEHVLVSPFDDIRKSNLLVFLREGFVDHDVFGVVGR